MRIAAVLYILYGAESTTYGIFILPSKIFSDAHINLGKHGTVAR